MLTSPLSGIFAACFIHIYNLNSKLQIALCLRSPISFYRLQVFQLKATNATAKKSALIRAYLLVIPNRDKILKAVVFKETDNQTKQSKTVGFDFNHQGFPMKMIISPKLQNFLPFEAEGSDPETVPF